MATKAEVLKSIKGSELYDKLHAPTKEIDRSDIEDGVNATGQATDRLMALQGVIKAATIRETDYPKEYLRMADGLKAMIQSAIVTLYADSEDGQISNADFKSFLEPLAGMTEGLLNLLANPDVAAQVDLRSMKRESAGKAFMSQLKKALREGATEGREGLFRLAKALSSLQTHILIGAEKKGELMEGARQRVSGLLDSLAEKAKGGDWDYLDELREVAKWGLVEKGLRKELIPPGLTKAKDEPKDEPEGEEPEQKTDAEKGLPKKIDKQDLAPDEKTGQKKTRLTGEVKFVDMTKVTDEDHKPGDRVWQAQIGGRRVASARRTHQITRRKGRVVREPSFESDIDLDLLSQILGSKVEVDLSRVRSLPEFKRAILEVVRVVPPAKSFKDPGGKPGTWDVYIGGKHIGQVTASSRQEARDAAAGKWGSKRGEIEVNRREVGFGEPADEE